MFDPNLPVNSTKVRASELRGQFNGLKALIDAVPAINAAQVDSTNTLPQGSPANASVSVIGNTLHFSFEIPQGAEGTQGMMGAQGPPFAQAVVDSVTTLNPGDPATVGVSFDGSDVRFTFGIPRGNEGDQGSVGEISQAQLDSAINGTSSNTNSVSTLDTGFSDPPSLADLEALRLAYNNLVLALRR